MVGWLEFNVPIQHICGHIREHELYHKAQSLLTLNTSHNSLYPITGQYRLLRILSKIYHFFQNSHIYFHIQKNSKQFPIALLKPKRLSTIVLTDYIKGNNKKHYDLVAKQQKSIS